MYYKKKKQGGKQDETTWLAAPMAKHLILDGWTFVQNISCTDNAQKGLPDYFAAKPGRQIWIEYKIVRNNSIKFEGSQKTKFKDMYNSGIQVYILCTRNDLSGKEGYRERMELLNKLRQPPNVHMMFETSTYKFLFRGVG